MRVVMAIVVFLLAVASAGTAEAATKPTAWPQRLDELHYYAGRGSDTEYALWAFESVNGLPLRDSVTAGTWRALEHPRYWKALAPGGGADRIEVSIARQVLVVYNRGRVVLISHVSTGSGRHFCDEGRCAYARTPVGDFRVYRREGGWVQSPLGLMYRPMFFYGGFAIHGSMYPLPHPASHGCVRVPMYVIGRVESGAFIGEPVYVR